MSISPLLHLTAKWICNLYKISEIQTTASAYVVFMPPNLTSSATLVEYKPVGDSAYGSLRPRKIPVEHCFQSENTDSALLKEMKNFGIIKAIHAGHSISA
eukprot:474806_1